MPTPLIVPASGFQLSPAVLITRVDNLAGVPAVQADIGSASITVYAKGGAMPVVYGPVALTVSSVFFNTLQNTDPRWTTDGVGYNFLYQVTGTAFASAGRYLIYVNCVDSGGNPIPLQFDYLALPVP